MRKKLVKNIILCKMRFNPSEVRLHIGKTKKFQKTGLLIFYEFFYVVFNLTSRRLNLINFFIS